MRTPAPSKKHGIKGFWIISYLVVFLMPLLVGVIAGTLMYNGFRNQVNERNSIVLDSVCTTVDSHIEAIVDASLQLYDNEYVNKIGTELEHPLSAADKYVLYEFTGELENIRGYETVEKYSDRFFIYFSGLDYIAHYSFVQSSETFYEVYINKDAYTLEEWNSFIQKKYNSEFLNANLLSDENELLFVRTLQLRFGEDKYINAVYKINTDKILSEVKNLYFYEYGNFSITDPDGNTVVTTNALISSENNSADGEDTLSFVKTSDVTGWTYTYTLPADKAYGNIYKILIAMVVLYVLCLFAGIWLIRYFIRRNYKPIDKLMTLFPENERNSKDNEFSYLNDKITESLSRNFALNQEIDSQSKMIREHLINEMLLGHEPVGKRSRTELEKLQFDLENNSFAVLIYSLGSKDIDELSMKQLVLCNVTDELLSNENYRFASIKKDEDVIYIICVEDSSVTGKIAEIARFLLSFTKKEFDFEFYSALGSVRSGKKSIGESYNEAKRALEYAIASSNVEYTEYNDVSASLKEGYFYSIELESQLVNLLKANEQKKVDALLSEIFSRNIKDDVSLDSVRYLMIELFGTVKRLMVQYGHSPEKEYPEESEFIENIFQSRDAQKMQQVIRSVYASCCRDVFQIPSHKDDLIAGVILYINQNYSNQNLSIRHIGDAFSMNADYISRKFREHTGKTINDYLRDVRIEKAKTLLRDSDELIADIAEMVGFTSYRTFVRVFTEIVGVTPNKYKAMK